MSKPIPAPTTTELLRHDTLCQFLWYVPGLVLLATLGLVVAPLFLPPGEQVDSLLVMRNGFLVVAAAVALPCGFFLVRRLARIQSLFATGERIRGHVTEIKAAARGYSTVVFAYDWEGRSHGGEAPVQSERMTKLQPGDWVTILVDPAAPADPLLAEAFDFR